MGFEISNPVAADRALGKHIGSCPWQSRLINLQEFTSRSIKDKVYYGNNDSPELFLQNLAKSLPANLRLPVIGYFRELDFWMDTTDTKAYEFSLSNTEGTRHYDLEYANYYFRYAIMIAGHGSSTIHEVAIPLHRHLCNNPGFNVPYRLFYDKSENRAVKFNLPASIKDPSSVYFRDITPRKDNITQVYAVVGYFAVKIPMIWMDQVSPIEEEIEFMPMIVGNAG